MEIRLPERISQTLVPTLIASKNKLYHDAHGELNWGFWVRSKEFFQWKLIDALSNSALKAFYKVYRDEFVYNPVKKFNRITLVETRANFDYFDEETNFTLRKGDSYLGIHIGPRYRHKIDLPNIKWSLGRMATYLDYFRDRLPSDLVVGLTYEKLASVSRRYGFRVAEAPLPSPIVKRFINMNEKFPLEYDISNPRICFQTCDDFIARFLPKTQSKA